VLGSRRTSILNRLERRIERAVDRPPQHAAQRVRGHDGPCRTSSRSRAATHAPSARARRDAHVDQLAGSSVPLACARLTPSGGP
jgi:hypothetical protein